MRGTRIGFVVIILLSAAVGCTDHRDVSTPTEPVSTPILAPSTPTSVVVMTLVDVPIAVDVTAGYTGTWNFAGQSVTAPGTGAFNNIRFNWYGGKDVPTAFGTLYLVGQEYLGLPRDLGPSTPGFVARSERVLSGEYVFPSTVTLRGGVQYWFYTDTMGSFTASFDTDIYPGGTFYVTGYPTLAFHRSPTSGPVSRDANFKLQGAAVSNP